ncbi:MAG TPA: dihydrodipicolinate reductase [Candidatus Dormibacteraeota bacterium]|nr:dihydrodipicolinate reductase [Candidatus Dormibacteraeota bacterium]
MQEGSEAGGLIGIVHYGLGPIGLAVAAEVAGRPWLRSVAAIDVSTELRGRPLVELTSTDGATREAAGSPAVHEALGPALASATGARVALHCTGSSLDRVAPQLVELAGAGLHVVSTTEELSFPWEAHPAAAAAIDAAAKRAGVTVLGTGINPGFAMDYLPITLSAVARRVDRVEVHRVQDAGTRRLPLQRKVGAGMDADAFRAAVAEGRLGHVGLPESARMLARAFGWRLTALEERIEPICAEAPTPASGGVIAAGQVLGLHQTLVGRAGDAVVVELTLDMAIGIGPARDHVRLHGRPEMELEVPGGLHGDTATAAIVVNAIPRVLAAAPGLVTMPDLPPPTPGSPGTPG